MTAPTPPSPDSGPHRPYEPWPHPSHLEHPGAGAEAGTGMTVRQETRDAVLVALAVAVLGVALGLLWAWLAPRVPLYSDGSAVYLRRPEGEEAIGADGTFVMLALALGAVVGTVVFWCRRQGGIGLVVGLAVGGLLGSLLAWRLGVWMGPEADLATLAQQAGKGETFDGPLELQAKGALLAWPFAALGAHLLFTALFGPRDPEPSLPEL